MLERLALVYSSFCSAVRVTYKWSPLITDAIETYRLFKIYEEMEEERKENKVNKNDVFDEY